MFFVGKNRSTCLSTLCYPIWNLFFVTSYYLFLPCLLPYSVICIGIYKCPRYIIPAILISQLYSQKKKKNEEKKNSSHSDDFNLKIYENERKKKEKVREKKKQIYGKTLLWSKT